MAHVPDHLPHEHEAPNEWHRHGADEHPQHEHGAQINAKSVWVWFILIVLFVAGTIAITMRYYLGYIQAEKTASIETTVLSKDYWEARAAAEDRLNSFGWSTPEAAKAGQVSIPIEQARAKVLESYGKKK
jgi:hypothetical protein